MKKFNIKSYCKINLSLKIIKKFYEKFNITVNVLSLGTGQAIEIAKNGDADILLVLSLIHI